MRAKESSVRSLGGVPAERPSRQRSFPKLLLWRISLIWMRARTFGSQVTSAQCSVALLQQVDDLFGLRSSKLCGWFIALFLPTRIFGRRRHGIQYNTPCCVLWVHAWNIYSLYCCCSNQPSDSTPPLPFMCDACKSSSSSPAIFYFFFCRALIKRFAGAAVRSRSIKSTFAKTPQKVGEPVTVCRTYTTSSASLLKSIEDLLGVGFLADRDVISEEERKQSAERQHWNTSQQHTESGLE